MVQNELLPLVYEVTLLLATQYCDGLRGPFVVYDPHDPHLHLYDYDDGVSYPNLVPGVSDTR